MTIKNIKKRWIVLGLILLPFVPQMPGCIMAGTPKFGRVIDVSTGKGMPNVNVIAAATFSAQVIEGRGDHSLYRIITHTDANGNYWIPNNWLHLAFALPGMDPQMTWVITAFQPGYAIVGDERAWKFDQWGWAEYRPRSTEFSPSAWWLGLVVWVDPIQMKPAQLNLKEAAVYYGDVISVPGMMPSILTWREPEEVALRKLGNQIFLPQICGMDSESLMDITAVGAVEHFVYDPNKFSTILRKLEPSGYQDIYQHPVFHAKNVCETMKASGE